MALKRGRVLVIRGSKTECLRWFRDVKLAIRELFVLNSIFMKHRLILSIFAYWLDEHIESKKRV